jgi:nitrogen-specific signal transduction histidine kinase
MAEPEIDHEWYKSYQDASCHDKLKALYMEIRQNLSALEGGTELLSKHFREELPNPITQEKWIWLIDRMQEAVIELKKLSEIARTDFGKSE